MTKHPIKYRPKQNNEDVHQYNWEVMKPFVHFGFKAMLLIGSAMIGIIKMLPDLLKDHHQQPKKDTRIIKI